MHAVDAERAADCAIDEITAQRRQWDRQNRRPPAMSAREALASLRFECLLLWTAWHNLLNGIELTDADSQRITIAMQRIEVICGEVDR
jgi:hypothetical protein